MIPAVADELLRLQDKQGVELTSADIHSLRKDFGVDEVQDSLLGVALRVLEVFQTHGRKDPRPSCDTEEQAALCSEEKAELRAKTKAECSEGATYGLVVSQGDHHTLAAGTLASFEAKFDKSFLVANRHGRGGQSQNRLARLAEESRLNHLKAVYERTERAFLAQDKAPLVEGIAVAGPGPTKSRFLEQLPRRWSSLVDRQLATTTQVGVSGLKQLVGQLKEQRSSSSEAERQRLRERRRRR
ncbi:uncharacterized protein LOC119588321, partial [Penaeus monodon]|uniref:uncharacterized protein LOC119588321 n=1 Tax=Penaeus monodon TaxID=6687 RepID=UPI0018A7AABF